MLYNKAYKKYAEIAFNIPALALQWAVTLTLNPDVCKQLNFTEQYDHVENELCKALTSSIYAEHCLISFELTRKNNIHIHILFTSSLLISKNAMKQHLLTILPKWLFGFFYIEYPYSPNRWIRYINKNPYYQEKYAYGFAD